MASSWHDSPSQGHSPSGAGAVPTSFSPRYSSGYTPTRTHCSGSDGSSISHSDYGSGCNAFDSALTEHPVSARANLSPWASSEDSGASSLSTGHEKAGPNNSAASASTLTAGVGKSQLPRGDNSLDSTAHSASRGGILSSAVSSTATATADQVVVVVPAGRYRALLALAKRLGQERAAVAGALRSERRDRAALAHTLSLAQTSLHGSREELRTYVEEIERLSFLHDSLVKKVSYLQGQVEEARAAGVKAPTSVISSLLQSATWESSELERVQQRVAALSSELDLKIDENEMLHMQVFELKQASERQEGVSHATTQTHTRDMDALRAILRVKEAELVRCGADLKAAHSTLRSVKDAALVASATAASTLARLREVVTTLQCANRELECRLARLAPFDLQCSSLHFQLDEDTPFVRTSAEGATSGSSHSTCTASGNAGSSTSSTSMGRLARAQRMEGCVTLLHDQLGAVHGSCRNAYTVALSHLQAVLACSGSDCVAPSAAVEYAHSIDEAQQQQAVYEVLTATTKHTLALTARMRSHIQGNVLAAPSTIIRPTQVTATDTPVCETVASAHVTTDAVRTRLSASSAAGTSVSCTTTNRHADSRFAADAGASACERQQDSTLVVGSDAAGTTSHCIVSDAPTACMRAVFAAHSGLLKRIHDALNVGLLPLLAHLRQVSRQLHEAQAGTHSTSATGIIMVMSHASHVPSALHAHSANAALLSTLISCVTTLVGTLLQLQQQRMPALESVCTCELDAQSVAQGTTDTRYCSVHPASSSSSVALQPDSVSRDSHHALVHSALEAYLTQLTSVLSRYLVVLGAVSQSGIILLDDAQAAFTAVTPTPTAVGCSVDTAHGVGAFESVTPNSSPANSIECDDVVLTPMQPPLLRDCAQGMQARVAALQSIVSSTLALVSVLSKQHALHSLAPTALTSKGGATMSGTHPPNAAHGVPRVHQSPERRLRRVPVEPFAVSQAREAAIMPSTLGTRRADSTIDSYEQRTPSTMHRTAASGDNSLSPNTSDDPTGNGSHSQRTAGDDELVLQQPRTCSSGANRAPLLSSFHVHVDASREHCHSHTASYLAQLNNRLRGKVKVPTATAHAALTEVATLTQSNAGLTNQVAGLSLLLQMSEQASAELHSEVNRLQAQANVCAAIHHTQTSHSTSESAPLPGVEACESSIAVVAANSSVVTVAVLACVPKDTIPMSPEGGIVPGLGRPEWRPAHVGSSVTGPNDMCHPEMHTAEGCHEATPSPQLTAAGMDTVPLDSTAVATRCSLTAVSMAGVSIFDSSTGNFNGTDSTPAATLFGTPPSLKASATYLTPVDVSSGNSTSRSTTSSPHESTTGGKEPTVESEPALVVQSDEWDDFVAGDNGTPSSGHTSTNDAAANVVRGGFPQAGAGTVAGSAKREGAGKNHDLHDGVKTTGHSLLRTGSNAVGGDMAYYLSDQETSVCELPSDGIATTSSTSQSDEHSAAVANLVHERVALQTQVDELSHQLHHVTERVVPRLEEQIVQLTQDRNSSMHMLEPARAQLAAATGCDDAITEMQRVHEELVGMMSDTYQQQIRELSQRVAQAEASTRRSVRA